MPISTQHKVIFVHIPKNAGKSIERSLSIVDKNDLKYKHQINSILSILFFKFAKFLNYPNLRKKGFGTGFTQLTFQHMTYLEIISNLKINKDYKWLACIRNPYTRVNSLYKHHALKNKNETIIEPFRSFVQRFFDSKKISNNFDFIAHRKLQRQFLELPNGQINPNIHLISYENINVNFDTFCNMINKNIKLKWHEKDKVMKKNHSIFFDQWSTEEIEIINDYYHKDFIEFGFKKLNIHELSELDTNEYLLPKKLI